MKVNKKIIGFLNSFSMGVSGGDIVFIELLKRMSGYQRTVITSLMGIKMCQSCGLKVDFRITSSESEFKNIIYIYLKRIMVSLLFKFKLQENDILMSSSDFLPDVIPAFFLRLKNRNSLWIQHIYHLIPYSRVVPYVSQKISFKMIKLLSDQIVVDNSLLKRELIGLGFDPQKITVNHPGIDLNYLTSIKSEDYTDYDGIFMAQLRQSKGISELVEIWALVCKKNPKFRLGIIGKGRSEVIDRLKSHIKNYNLNKNIDIFGYLPYDRAFSIIRKSKVFIFPSYEEGFGIAALEAQALGLPIVAWNLPVYDEIFPKGMIKVEIGNISKFAKEVLRLFNNKKKYQTLKDKAKINASKYNINMFVQRELSIIRSLSK